MRRSVLSLSLEGTMTVITVHGSLDCATVEPLRSVLALLRRDADVVVDIRDVDFCDSAGVWMLAGSALDASACGHELTVRHPHPCVEHVLRLTGCDWLVSAGA